MRSRHSDKTDQTHEELLGAFIESIYSMRGEKLILLQSCGEECRREVLAGGDDLDHDGPGLLDAVLRPGLRVAVGPQLPPLPAASIT